MDTAKAVPGVGVLNAFGISLYGAQVIDAYQNYANGQGGYFDALKGFYGTAGLVKEAAETMSVLIQNTPRWGWSQKLAGKAAFGPLASSNRGIGLAITPKLVTQPGWVKFATYFKLGSVNLDGYAGIWALANGRLGDGFGYSVSAGGGWFATATSLYIREWKPAYEATFGLTREAASKLIWIGKFGPVIGGGVSLLASAALAVYQDYEAAIEYEKPAVDFLTKLGYKHKVATQLADYDSEGRSAGLAIGALLDRAGVSRDIFRNYVNGLPDSRHDNLNGLAIAARRMPFYDDGTFPRWAPNDSKITTGSSGFLYGRVAIFDRKVSSLEGLDHLARALFPDFPGAAP
jgi:hypothetical protein